MAARGKFDQAGDDASGFVLLKGEDGAYLVQYTVHRRKGQHLFGGFNRAANQAKTGEGVKVHWKSLARCDKGR